MGKKRVAAAYIFGQKYKDLAQINIIEEVSVPPPYAFKLSPNFSEHRKLDPRDYYKLLETVFFSSHPLKTKTARSSLANC